MKSNVTFSIPKPCHENWNAMTPNEKGRFCQSCSKTVIDFTGMGTEQIQEYLSNYKTQNVCGKLKSSQLNTLHLKIPETVFSQRFNAHRLFLLALFLSMGTTILSCKDINGTDTTVGKIEIVQKQDEALGSNLKTTSNDNCGSQTKETINQKDLSLEEPLIMGEIVEVMGFVIPEVKEPFSYYFVDEKPRFSGTPIQLSEETEREYFNQRVSEFVKKEFDTLIAKKANLKGIQRVYVQFEIDTIGQITNIKTRAPHPNLGKEAERVIRLLPDFIPAKHLGKTVSTLFNLPIVMRVDD